MSTQLKRTQIVINPNKQELFISLIQNLDRAVTIRVEIKILRDSSIYIKKVNAI